MTERVRILIEQAKQLTSEERADVLEALLALEDDREAGDAAWAEEARRRLEAVRSGEPTYDAVEAIEDIRQRLARRRAK